jgi:hypothetical protein
MSLSRNPHVSYNSFYSLALYLFLSNLLSAYRYAGLGCSTQTDQELFAILHSSKEVPIPLEKEIGMTLAPIRMKPEHPSTALPISSRIHFGRAYGIGHDIPVKSLGLIHAGSMQKLISQSEAHVYRTRSGSNLQNLESQNLGAVEVPIDQHIIPADMEAVKSMRYSIMDVLGGTYLSAVIQHPRNLRWVLVFFHKVLWIASLQEKRSVRRSTHFFRLNKST